MPIDKDIALNFYVHAAHKALIAPPVSETHTLLMLQVCTRNVLHAHENKNASDFRRSLISLAATCAIMEQWTQPAPEDCECPECSANAAAEERAKREQQAAEESQDLTLRDFWWTIHGDASAPFGAMIVTRQRSSYPHINLNQWKLVRARDYGHAVVKAADAANVKN